MVLHLKRLLFGYPDRLRSVFRFGTCRRHVPENVAEHSYYVSLYTLMLCRVAQSAGVEVDYGKALRGAVLHDLEEAITGDFPRPFKYSTSALRLALESASVAAVKQLSHSLFDDETSQQWLERCWADSKDSSFEGAVVEVADFLSCVAWIVREHQCGNTALREHIATLPDYYRRFMEPRYVVFAELLKSNVAPLIKSLMADAPHLTGEEG